MNDEVMEAFEAIEGEEPLAWHALGQGLRLRRKELKRLRASLITAGLDEAAHEIDEELNLLLGKGDDAGLLKLFGVDDDTLERKKAEEEKDPAQRDIDDPRDYRTHGMNTEQVRELVSSVASDNPPAAAVRIMNALEDGEHEREGGARKSVLDVIRAARAPVAKRVEPVNEAGPALAAEG